MAEPVTDISNVTIFPTKLPLPCAVYGDISAYDKLDLTLPIAELYRRDADHAELISESGQALSVIGLDKILFMQQPVISLSLKVKDSGDEDEDDAFIARGNIDLHTETKNDYEEVKQSDVAGDLGYATVNYVALSCALVAHVRLYLSGDIDVAAYVQGTGSQQVSDLKCSLSGTIVVHYGKTCGVTNHFGIPLLNVPSDQFIPIFYDGHPTPGIKLSRNYVAVPAYSTLNIKANLRSTLSTTPDVVNEESTITLWPNNWRCWSKFKDNKIPIRNAIETMTNWMELCDLEPSSRHTLRKTSEWEDEIMFEVFSVFIGRENDHDLKVSGKITLEHKDFSAVIFDRDDNDPDQLLDGRKLLTITCPSSPEFELPLINLIMRVKLKDVDNRFLIDDGNVRFNTTVIEDWEAEFDKPLCSVVKGDNGGYCALHYSMFISAARVSLKIVLLCKGVDVARVHGNIVAWSDIFDYTREYNRKYYRRVLYDEPDDKDYYTQKVAEHDHGKVKLSESYLAVPSSFNFNIAIDLYASSHTTTEHLHKTLLFNQLNKELKMEFPGGYFELQMIVS